MPSKFYYFTLVLIFSALAVFIFNDREKIFNPTFVGNLHTHTTCSDGENSYEEMIAAALKLNFKFIAITDHKFCPEVIAKCKAEKRTFCIAGQEVTSSRTHLLAINISKAISPRLSLKDQVKEIHKQGGMAIAAHPYMEIFKYEASELTDSGIDAMECANNITEEHPLPCVYDSDAHNTFYLGYQSTTCFTPINNFSDLKSAIISGKCSRSAFTNINYQISPPKLVN